MHRTSLRYVRKGWLPSFMKKSAPESQPSALTEEQQERLRQMSDVLTVKDEEIRASARSATSLLDAHINEDAIRARGVAKYKNNYTPPADAESIVKTTVAKVLDGYPTSESLADNNALKFKMLMALSKSFNGHRPRSSQLAHLNTVEDLAKFYCTPYKNINPYVELARSESKPANLTCLERPFRFHPEDTDAYHKGVTAFPGTGGQVFGLRNKRLYRQFKPKVAWFDYEDQAFDYELPDKDMPWDPEIVKKMDSFTNKRYNHLSKTFAPVKNRPSLKDERAH